MYNYLLGWSFAVMEGLGVFYGQDFTTRHGGRFWEMGVLESEVKSLYT